jgi:RecA-family ATPase
MGERWLGRYEMQRTPVMYLDEEMGVVRVLPRIKKLGIPRNADLLYANRAGVKLDNNRHREEIVREIVKHGIKIVVVDSLTRIHNLDEGSNRDMARLYSCMRDIMDAGATLVVCHHDRKGGQGDSNVGHDRARGAGDIMAAADMVYSVEKSENVHKLVCTKSRLVAEEDAISCSFVIEDSEDRNFTYVRAINHQEKSSRALDATEEAVVGFLRAAITANTSEIKNGVPMNAQKVQAALESLIRNGEVIFQAGQRGAKEYTLRSKESSGIF